MIGGVPISGACVGVVVGAGATVPVAIVGATTVVGVGVGSGATVTVVVSVTVTVGCASVVVGSAAGCSRGVAVTVTVSDVPILRCRIFQRCGENASLLEQREGAVCVATGAGVVGLLEGGGELHHGGVVAKQ